MITRYQVQGTQSDSPLELEIGLTTVYVRWDIKRVENDEFEGWVYNETQYSKDEYIALLADKQQVNQIETKLLNADERYQLLDKSDILLEDLKQFKLEQLKYFCSEAIYNGFKSSVNDYEFGFNELDQINFTQQTLLIVSLQGNYNSPIHWKTKNQDVVELTVEQFNIIINDATTHKLTQQNKYWQLEQQVLSAETIEDVDAIVW